MKKETLEFVVEETQKLLAAPSCSAAAKQAAQEWLDAVGTDQQDEETRTYVHALEMNIELIDELIAFLGTTEAKEFFGEEGRAQMMEHARERKQAGEPFCDCPACAAVEAMLKRKEEILS